MTKIDYEINILKNYGIIINVVPNFVGRFVMWMSRTWSLGIFNSETQQSADLSRVVYQRQTEPSIILNTVGRVTA